MTRFTFLAPLLVSLAACNGGGGGDGGPPDARSDLTVGDLGGDAVLPVDLGMDALRMDAPLCVDADGDGHGAISCGGDDCDDADANRYPSNVEVCDSAGHDEDCSPATLGPDRDGDGFAYWGCCNRQPDGSTLCGTDCNDTAATINPSAVESCDGLDDNCNGMIDEGVASVYCFDTDGDAHGSLGAAASGCGMPIGATTICNDCAEGDPTVYPGATETCDGFDNNCNGAIDEGCSCAPDGVTQPCGFSFGACMAGVQTCIGTTWEATCAGATLPMLEVCNGVDDDCDGMTDEGLVHTFYPDCDGDGFGADTRAVTRCAAPTGVPPGCPRGVWTTTGGDCDDTDAARTPSAGCGVTDGGIDGGPSADGGADSGATPPATAVTVGDHFACALLTDGEVLCQGRGTEGERGNGTALPWGEATFVSGLTDAVEIVAGGGSSVSGHVCARRAGGSVVCWGASNHGELGFGGFASHLRPTAVFGIADARQLAAGYEHTCALRSDGTVACWGAGSSGQLGNGGTADSAIPDVVSGLIDAVEIASGEYHTCARRMTGAVACWGNDYRGQLGDGARTNQPTAVTVGGLSGTVMQLAAGRYDTCALMSDGTVQCWGANESGQLGRGTRTTDELVPAPVLGLSGARRIALGASHSCALTATGGVQCWGNDYEGELGTGGIGDFPSSPVSTSYPFVDTGLSIAAGDVNTCAVSPTTGAFCWGNDDNGQILYGLPSDPATSPMGAFTTMPL